MNNSKRNFKNSSHNTTEDMKKKKECLGINLTKKYKTVL